MKSQQQIKHCNSINDINCIKDFVSSLPYTLTNAQKKVIGEIANDLKRDIPMNRLVQGDVGSGKTVVSAAAIYAAAKNGYQAVLMAPTEILAIQHYENFLIYCTVLIFFLY